MDDTDFGVLEDEVLRDLVARTAGVENDLRRELARQIQHALNQRNLEELAEQAHVPILQVRRLLHEDVGGSLAITTLIRVADVLKLKVQIVINPR